MCVAKVFVIAIGVMSYFEMMHRLRSKYGQPAAVDEVPADEKAPDSTGDRSSSALGNDTK